MIGLGGVACFKGYTGHRRCYPANGEQRRNLVNVMYNNVGQANSSSSLFDAVDQAIEQWSRLWWSTRAAAEVQVGNRLWRARLRRVFRSAVERACGFSEASECAPQQPRSYRHLRKQLSSHASDKSHGPLLGRSGYRLLTPRRSLGGPMRRDLRTERELASLKSRALVKDSSWFRSPQRINHAAIRFRSAVQQLPTLFDSENLKHTVRRATSLLKWTRASGEGYRGATY
jgi:hypothetical protein